MGDKKVFVFKIVWRKSIASLHRLTQAVQRANLRRTAGDLTWVALLGVLVSVGRIQIGNNLSQVPRRAS